MRIFHYDAITKEFLGEGLADECQIEPGTWHIPAYATSVAPPATEKNRAALFNEDSQSWKQLPDYRDQKIYKKDDYLVCKVVTLIGDIPDGFTLLVPFDFAVWNEAENKWVMNAALKRSSKIGQTLQERNMLLSETDWTQLPDSPLTPAKRAEFLRYRSELRDITKAEGWPDIKFPDPPSKGE